MKIIGVLFGMENSYPGALVEHINARNVEGIQAEFVDTGAVHLNRPPRYAVIVDRISHDIPFYRALLKHAALHGTVIINNPFWWSADDKFFNYTLAEKMGVAVPPTVILPHKNYPEGTTDRSMRNLEFPLDWDGVFNYVGEHGFLKPVDGGGWRDVYHVRNRDEFFRRRVVEKLVVGRPPEGVVNKDSAVQRGVLQKGTVERNVVRNAVDDDGIARRAVEVDGAGVHEFRLDSFYVARVDVLDQCAGEAVLHAEQNADLFHAAASESVVRGEVHPTLATGTKTSRGWGAQT